ncbi:hypothetical protein D3C81_2061760 [compost metagenome]
MNNYSDKALHKAKQIERKIKGLESLVPENPIARKKEITLATEEFNARKILQVDDLTVRSAGGAELYYIKP